MDYSQKNKLAEKIVWVAALLCFLLATYEIPVYWVFVISPVVTASQIALTYVGFRLHQAIKGKDRLKIKEEVKFTILPNAILHAVYGLGVYGVGVAIRLIVSMFISG